MKIIQSTLVLLYSVILSACGGGGDSGLGNSVPTTPLNITATNQQAVTAAVLNTTSGAAIDAFTVDDFLNALNGNACAGGSANLFPTSATAGTITFFGCSYQAGKSFNGTVKYSGLVTSPADNIFNPDTVTAKLNFDLTVTRTLNAPFALLGDYNFSTNGLNTLSITTSATAPSSLKVSSNITEAISNFSFQKTALSSSSTSIDNFFTLASSYLGGVINFDTTTAFLTNDALNRAFPSTGVAIVTSTANLNQLRITILGDESSPVSSQVKIELSQNSGLTYNPPIYYAWADLFP